MEVARELAAKSLKAYDDSMLIINQVRGGGGYEVCHEDLIPYRETASKMVKEFNNFYIPHQQNAHADVLASLAASLALSA